MHYKDDKWLCQHPLLGYKYKDDYAVHSQSRQDGGTLGCVYYE
jgi:hypothetical protein